MKETFGDFTEQNGSSEFLIMSFSSKALPVTERWRNNSLSANFLADYWGTFFPVHDQSRLTEVQDAVSFIANELLENALKFSIEADPSTIRISLYLFDKDLRFYVTNTIDPPSAQKFRAFLQRILTEDPHELYLSLLEGRGSHDDNAESRLGFLTILNDYEARLGWKFEAHGQPPEEFTVTTMVQLAIVRAQP